MKAYFISNFTKHPKLMLENNQMIDLFDDANDTGVILNAIDTVVGTYKLDEIVVHDGEMIEYETMDDMKTHRVELDIDRYKLHKVMDGRPIGVVFEHEGREYRITRKFQA